jgi:hypothetical protein
MPDVKPPASSGALAPHIEILKLTIPCVVGHLPVIIHAIPSVLALITILKL